MKKLECVLNSKYCWAIIKTIYFILSAAVGKKIKKMAYKVQ